MMIRPLILALILSVVAQTAFAQFLPLPVPAPPKVKNAPPPKVIKLVPVNKVEPANEGNDKEKEAKEKEKDKDKDKAEKINPLFERLVQPDRNLQRRFEQAERLANAGRYAEAGQLLGSILEGSLDYLVPPPPDFPLQRTATETFDAAIAGKIRQLPEAGRNSYAMQYETLAQRLLGNAIQNGSLEGIQIVSQNYFPTPAGLDATFLLGMSQFEQGATGSAMFTLRKLQQKGLKTDAHEPTLSLTLATCQLRLGMKEDAQKTVESFLQRHPQPMILLAGSEQWTPQNVDEVIAKLEQSIGPPRPIAEWLERAGWLLTFGTPSQNPSTQTDKPLLELLWQIPMFGRADNASEARLLQNVVRRANEVYIPASQPLIVNNRLIQRGMLEMTAVDIRTGKRVWRSADADYRLPSAIAPSFNQFRAYGRNATSRFMLRVLLWHDRIQQGMSSDGKRIYSIEGLDLSPNFNYGNPWGGGGPRIHHNGKQFEDPRPRPGNTLVARDARTGQVVWRTGKFPVVQKIFDQMAEEIDPKKKSNLPPAPDAQQPTPTKKEKKGDEKKDEKDSRNDLEATLTDEERFLGETWFLGVPLPMYGCLNVIGENGGMLRLFVLDAQTGKLIRQQPLVQPPIPFETDWLRRYYGLTPTSANGILFCPTALGMIIAVDATTGSPLWCFSYLNPPKDDPNDRNNMRNQRYFTFGTSGRNDEFQRMFEQSGWQVPAMMIEGNRLIVAPSDAPSIYCLDIATGKLVWQKSNLKRPDTLYVACIRNGKVFIVTPVSMLALSMTDGEPLWKYTLASVQTQKQGTVGRSDLSNIRKRIQSSNDEVSKFFNTRNAEKENGEPPDLRFPKGIVPSGVGVHSDAKYYLPLSDGTVAVIDLDRGVYETVSPSQTFASGKVPPPSDTIETPTNPLATEIEEALANSEGGPSDVPLPALSSFREDITLGNLVGIHGMLFSQSPLRTTCFDQFEPLKKRAESLLQQDPNDPVGLLQLGRIRRAEANIPEAIALFRRSLQATKSEPAAMLLRKSLLDALRSDYPAWSGCKQELESLSKLPEELGETLLVLAQGAIRAGQPTEFLDALNQSFRLEADNPIQIPVEEGVNARLSRAFGTLIEQNIKKTNEKFEAPLKKNAEDIFRQLSLWNEAAPGSDSFRTSPWWEPVETPKIPPEIRRWRLFTEYFRTFPVSRQAAELLLGLYEKHELYSMLEATMNPPVQWFIPGIDVSAVAMNDSEQKTEQERRAGIENAEPDTDFFGRPMETSKSKTSKPKPSTPNVETAAMGPAPPTTIGMVDPPASGFYDGVLPGKKRGETASIATPIDLAPPTTPMADIHRLATLLESQDNGADAFYYYRQLNLLYADKKIGTETGRDIYRNALARPLLKEYYEREVVRTNWPTGAVEYQDEPVKPVSDPTAVPQRRVPNGLLQAIRSGDRQMVNRVVVPIVGSYEPFQSPYTYALETSTVDDCQLVCYDTQGNTRWRCDMSTLAPEIEQSGYFHEFYQQGFGFQQMYVKGCNHLLLFVRRNTMIAIDTFRLDETGSPKVLWTKTLASPQAARQIYGGLRIDHIEHGAFQFWNYQNTADNQSLSDPVHLLPEVICYKDADLIYGVDPSNGETLWTRDVPSFRCSMLSDRNSLFFHLGESNQVVAIDPSSGKELANGVMPKGAFFAFETNVVCCAPSTSGQYKLFVCDVKDIFNQKPARERALAVSYDTSGASVAVPTIQSHVIRDGMTGDTTVRFVQNNRFLATLTRPQATLKIYDLLAKKDFFGEKRGSSGQRLGVKLKQQSGDQRFRHGNWNLDIDVIDGNYLVLFVENPSFGGGQKPATNNDGKQVLRSRSNLNNVPSIAVGLGSLMLYDVDGKPLWNETVKVEEWYRLTQLPSALPVVLFGVSVTDQMPNGQASFMTVVRGIDKKTGATRFSPQIPADRHGNAIMQGFRVATDPKRFEMSLIAPNRTFTVRFTDNEKPTTVPAEEKPSEKPPVKPVPKKPAIPGNFWPWPFG